jgi:hypothetical protein
MTNTINRTIGGTTTQVAIGVEPQRFPGGTIAGVSMIAAPVLLLTGAALLLGIYVTDTGDQLTELADHRGRAMAAINFAVAGTILAALAVAGLGAAICRQQPRLGRVGGALTIVGLFGPAFFLGATFLSIDIADLADHTGATAAVEDATSTPNIVNLCGPALVAGFIVLAIGAARSGVLSRPRSWALGLTAIAPVGLISGVIVIAIAAWLCMAVALVPLGWRSLRS